MIRTVGFRSHKFNPNKYKRITGEPITRDELDNFKHGGYYQSSDFRARVMYPYLMRLAFRRGYKK